MALHAQPLANVGKRFKFFDSEGALQWFVQGL